MMSDNLPRPYVILASSSPRRRDLVASLGLDFQIHASHADERVPDPVAPADYVRIVAARKAAAVRSAVASDHPPTGVILAADTAVVIDGAILGKPVDRDDAFAKLSLLQGRTHEVYSGICLVNLADGRELCRSRSTKVTMKPLSPAQLWAYIETGEPLDKAGAYGIQGFGATLVESISGDYFNVVGLSLALLADMLEALGYSLLPTGAK